MIELQRITLKGKETYSEDDGNGVVVKQNVYMKDKKIGEYIDFIDYKQVNIMDEHREEFNSAVDFFIEKSRKHQDPKILESIISLRSYHRQAFLEYLDALNNVAKEVAKVKEQGFLKVAIFGTFIEFDEVIKNNLFGIAGLIRVKGIPNDLKHIPPMTHLESFKKSLGRPSDNHIIVVTQPNSLSTTFA